MRVSFHIPLGYCCLLGARVLMSRSRRPGMKTPALTHVKKKIITNHFCLFGPIWKNTNTTFHDRYIRMTHSWRKEASAWKPQTPPSQLLCPGLKGADRWVERDSRESNCKLLPAGMRTHQVICFAQKHWSCWKVNREFATRQRQNAGWVLGDK